LTPVANRRDQRDQRGRRERQRTDRNGRPDAAAPPGDGWLAYPTVPLRFFLGATFLFAGLQKIADPGFLSPGSQTYIGTQLEAFAAHSPIGFLITTFALPTAQLTGVAVIATELAVGVLVVAGIATRWAAAVGALVNFVFFLTASWMVQPYFLGSDSIYTVAWITLVLAGDQRLLTVWPLLFGESAVRRASPIETDLDRRRLLLQLGGAAVAVVWALAILPRTRAGAVASTPTPSPLATPTPGGTPSAGPVATPAGTKVGTRADLLVEGFLDFTDPKTGDPAIAVALSGDRVVAFDAVCTHAGCEVRYDSTDRMLACPCHTAVFDPSRNAAVVSGPAPTPLASIPIQVASNGDLYAT
jgi:thiosulfate dehydrogenase [quinone] large subunit